MAAREQWTSRIGFVLATVGSAVRPAIVMLVVGVVVLYGGLAWCVAIANRRRD